MSRGKQTSGKRAREAERDRKKTDKVERLRRNRANSEGGIPIASAAEIQVAAMSTPTPNLENDGSSDRAPRMSGPPCRLFVGSLSFETSTQDLRELFGKFGHVLDAAVMIDRSSGMSRGFGFITMDRKSAMAAVHELDGQEIQGRNIRVNVATERTGGP